MTSTKSYKNRITGYGDIDPKTIKLNPNNPNTHWDLQEDVMDEILESTGWVQSIIVNKTTGNLLDGELRVKLAIKHKEESVPVTYIDLSESEEKEALLMFTQIGRFARVNQVNLHAIIDQTVERSKNVADFVKQVAARNRIELKDIRPAVHNDTDETQSVKDKKRASEKPEDFVDEKWRSLVSDGQIWELGESRLLVGDSLVSSNLDKLFNTERCDCIVTDPPYGIKYIRSESVSAIARSKMRNKPQGIEGDDLNGQDQREFTKNSFTLFLQYSADLAPVYMFSALLEEGLQSLLGLKDAGVHMQSQLIWSKEHLNPGQCDYQWSHEVLWYGWKPGKGEHNWYGGRDKTTVLRYRAPNKTIHPNEKPVSLLSHLIVNSTKEYEIVFDPFVGSGSTIIAADTVRRKCYACEKDLLYAAYALQRFEKERNITPTLKEG